MYPKAEMHDGVEDLRNVFDDAMEEEGGGKVMGTIGESEIWFDPVEQENLLDVNDSCIFHNNFPPVPDFPCMSSSSSSSPLRLISSSSTASSVSSSCSAVEAEAAPVAPPALSSTEAFSQSDGGIGDVDCMDVMENFGYMDLIDGNDVWDPSSVFTDENPPEIEEEPQEDRPVLDELGAMFFEWLKANKNIISAEDMRNIKLKRSTIESASKRLGSTKEGMKQLLKLILQWVEQYQLHKKRVREAAAAAAQFASCQHQDPFQNPNLYGDNPTPADPNTCFSPAPWISPPPPPLPQPQTPCVSDPLTTLLPFPTVMGYNMGDGDPCCNGNLAINYYLYNPNSATDYQMLDCAPQWPPSEFNTMAVQYNKFPDKARQKQTGAAGYEVEYPYPIYDANGERIMRFAPSVTKEARKKRMARQRRIPTHHRRRNQNQNQNQNQTTSEPVRLHGGENWVILPSAEGGSAVQMMPMPVTDAPQRRPPAVQGQKCHRQAPSERRQGWRPDKSLKYLLQKVLKQSDVGNLGRIVLPKKEAETHLPVLEARDGITIPMEDIGTSRVWNMRYRFWPNNKSRMYLLENTGDFVRANGLQEGDFIVIYSDVKCGKYLIRGVKVRQPELKAEGKKPARKNPRNSAQAGNGSSSSPHQANSEAKQKKKEEQ